MVQWEYKVGPLTINFRVLLEPKGFLRIIILFIALLAFATTAGFNSGSQSNSLTCLDSTNTTNFTGYMTFGYPYASGSYALTSNFNLTNTTQCNDTRTKFRSLPLSSSAQFYVAMGVLTMIYVVGALLVYMMFITPELFMAKWLVIADFFVTLAFGILYVIACIAWTAGAVQLSSYVVSSLEQFGLDCFNCTSAGVSGAVNVQTFGQPIISLLLGWLAAFVWLASSWFVYKDTMWHKDQTGPLASLYNIRSKGGSDGGEQATDKE